MAVGLPEIGGRVHDFLDWWNVSLINVVFCTLQKAGAPDDVWEN